MAFTEKEIKDLNKMNRASQNVGLGDFLGSISDVAGVYASLESSGSTLITSSGEYYAIKGTFDNDPVENFSGIKIGDDDAIQYDGESTKYFEIIWSAVLSGSPTNLINAYVCINKNEVLQDLSVMSNGLLIAGNPYNLSGVFCHRIRGRRYNPTCLFCKPR
jgi:hypothetical protein